MLLFFFFFLMLRFYYVTYMAKFFTLSGSQLWPLDISGTKNCTYYDTYIDIFLFFVFLCIILRIIIIIFFLKHKICCFSYTFLYKKIYIYSKNFGKNMKINYYYYYFLISKKFINKKTKELHLLRGQGRYDPYL